MNPGSPKGIFHWVAPPNRGPFRPGAVEQRGPRSKEI